MEPGGERAIGEWEEAKGGISSAHGESCPPFLFIKCEAKTMGRAKTMAGVVGPVEQPLTFLLFYN